MKKLIFVLICFLLFASLLYAQPANWTGKIEVKGGVIFVQNPKQGLWDDDQSKILSLDSVLSIGYYEGPEDYLFTRVADIAVDKQGNIYAADKECIPGNNGTRSV